MKKVRITYSGTAQLRELIWCWLLRFVPLPSPVYDYIMDFEHFDRDCLYNFSGSGTQKAWHSER